MRQAQNMLEGYRKARRSISSSRSISIRCGIAQQKGEKAGGKIRARDESAGRLHCGASKEEATGR